MKKAKMGRATRYTAWRPYLSLRCGVIIGAKAMPKRYSENPKMATCIVTSRCCTTPVMPGVYAVAPNAL